LPRVLYTNYVYQNVPEDRNAIDAYTRTWQKSKHESCLNTFCISLRNCS